MKTLRIIKPIGLLAIGLYALFGAQTVFAVAGTPVDNRAVITYDVGSTTETIESSPTGNTTTGAGNGTDTRFVEDRLVNFQVTVVDANEIEVAPSETDAVLTFTVTNLAPGPLTTSSNGHLDFRLTAVDRAITTANPFTAPPAADNRNIPGANVSVFVESNAVPDGYQSATDTATFIDELAPGATATVYIVSDIPGASADDDLMVMSLVATAAEALDAVDGTGSLDTGNLGADLVANTGVDNVGTIDNIFIDAAGDIAEDGSSPDIANDGFHSDSSAYLVNLAELTVTKVSVVISDPVNNTTNPKAIPGAIVEYTVTISNAAGAATADNVDLADSLATEIGSGSITYETDTYNGQGTCPGGGAPNPCGILVTAPDINGGAAQAITNTNGDGDNGDFTANIVNMAAGNLDAGESATVQFRVEVQ